MLKCETDNDKASCILSVRLTVVWHLYTTTNHKELMRFWFMIWLGLWSVVPQKVCNECGHYGSIITFSYAVCMCGACMHIHTRVCVCVCVLRGDYWSTTFLHMWPIYHCLDFVFMMLWRTHYQQKFDLRLHARCLCSLAADHQQLPHQTCHPWACESTSWGWQSFQPHTCGLAVWSPLQSPRHQRQTRTSAVLLHGHWYTAV